MSTILRLIDKHDKNNCFYLKTDNGELYFNQKKGVQYLFDDFKKIEIEKIEVLLECKIIETEYELKRMYLLNDNENKMYIKNLGWLYADFYSKEKKILQYKIKHIDIYDNDICEYGYTLLSKDELNNLIKNKGEF